MSRRLRYLTLTFILVGGGLGSWNEVRAYGSNCDRCNDTECSIICGPPCGGYLTACWETGPCLENPNEIERQPLCYCYYWDPGTAQCSG